MKSLKPHPLAELLPPMTEDEFTALKADIAANGQVDDIELLDGMILDGRHRYRACIELKIEPRTRDYRRKLDPVDFVGSRANHRNMGEGQKATAAVLFEPEFAKQAARRMKAGAKVDPADKGTAAAKAATLFGAKERSVYYAKLLLNHDRKGFDAVFNGRETLSRAVRQVHRNEKRKVNARRVTNLPATPDTRWEIRHGDCIKLFDERREKILGGPKPEASLVIADPPYNEGIDYGDGGKADALPHDKYLDFSRRWMQGCHDSLLGDGTFALIINMEWAAELVVIAKEIGFHLRNWVIWYETFGVNCPSKFNRTARHIPIFTKSPSRFTFNADAVMRPSDRQTKYKDKRAVAGGKVMDDVWLDIPRLVENAAERVPDFPTQIPEALIKRLIEAHSNPGDYVLDPFSGSGTTVACCLQTGRRGLGIEKNPRYVELSRLRCSAVIPPAKEAAAK